MVDVSSWGRLSRQEHAAISLNNFDQLKSCFENYLPGLPHGMGRSYGDVCLNPQGSIWITTQLDHFIAFDESTGRLICESGVLLKDIQQTMIPRGWILPVTPGTQMVTVGGAIANDVHGKNHHRQGTFGDHVKSLTLMRTDGEVIHCGPNERPEWFEATVGGLGLTGLITTAELQLLPIAGPWLETETISYHGLDEFFQLSASSEAEWDYTVSWIDCLSGKAMRGLFMRGNHIQAEASQKPKAKNVNMPIVPPISLVNKLTLRPFNTIYYNMQKRKAGRSVVYYEPFFYPLDHVQHWNRMYGPKGFFQYQSVIPHAFGKDAVAAMLKEISSSGEGSFLAVLKVFGNKKPVGMLSFPQPGVTLALDFPNNGTRTAQLFERLDAIVRDAKGRLYMAKDARMPRDLFEMGYPNFQDFLKFRDQGICSGLSCRLMGY